MKTIVVDLDGCVFDTQKVVEQRLKSKGYVEFSLDRVLCYDFNKSLKEEYTNLVRSKSSPQHDYPYYCGAPREEIFAELADPIIYKEVFNLDYNDSDAYKQALGYLRYFMQSSEFRVIFQSVSYTQAIAQAKDIALQRLFSGEDYEYLVEIGDVEKVFPENTLYVIEDNIRVGKHCRVDVDDVTKPLLLLIRKAWNNPHCDATIKDTDNTFSVKCNTLLEALKYIYERECRDDL